MQELYGRFGNLAQLAAQKLHVKSALNPILWLCGISTSTCFVFAYLFHGTKAVLYLLISAGILPIVIACLTYVGFAIFKPDKLQSEEYQLRVKSLQLIQQKGGKIKLPPTSLELITNPFMNKNNTREDK
jgi:hypothetical protein